MSHKKRIGLALGGGGARGFAHLGVLRAFQKAGIPMDIFAGTSMGAIMGAAFLQSAEFKTSHRKVKNFVINYAKRFRGLNYVETDKELTENIFSILGKQINRGKVFLDFMRHSHLEDESLLDEIVNDFIHPCNIQELHSPLYICSIDFKSGQALFFNQGNCRQAIKCSMSIPGYFPPQRMDGRLMYDAQAVYPVPIQIFESLDVDLLISVDVGLPIDTEFELKTGVDLLFRQNDILYSHVLAEVDNCSDLVIRPETQNIHWTDFHNMDTIIKRGLEAGERAVPQILKMLEPSYEPTPMKDRPWHNSAFKTIPRVVVNPLDNIKN